MQDSQTKGKRSMKSLLWIMQYIFHYRVQAIFMLIAAVAGNLLALAIPGLTGGIINSLEGGWSEGLLNEVVKGCIMIAGVAAASWILTVLQGRLMLYCAQHMVHRLRHDVFEKLMKLPVAYFDFRSKGDIISIISTDIDNISDTVSSDLVTLISGVVTVAGSLVYMLRLSPSMTLVFVFTVPAMYIVSMFISRKARVLHRRRKESLGILTGYTEEMVTAQKTVKVYGLEEYNTNRFAGYAEDLRENGWRAEYQSSKMMPTMNGINNVNFTLVCAIGAFLVLGGKMSVGGISEFIQLSKRFAGPIVESANIISLFQTSLAACDRVFTILMADDEPTGNTAKLPVKIEGNIKFKDVEFFYNPQAHVLKDINLTMKPGTCTAIVGSTGSGKTTLISLLMRFYDVSSGKILLDGVNINDVDVAELRRNFALILQDSWLFEGTVYENIGYAAPPELATNERIEALCREIHIDSFIRALPAGYNTVLKNDTGSLSQGQKQLLNIARAFLCNPSVFILDEATSSVDTLLEKAIQKTTNQVIKGKTSIIIAHRLSTILQADNILMMKDGEVVESGTHTELMKKNGIYRNLYESQFENSLKTG